MIRMRRLEDLDPVADKASYKNIYNALNIAGLTNKTSLGQQRWFISLHQSGDPHLLLKQGLKKHQHFQTIECVSKGWLCFWHKCWNIHDFWLLTIKRKTKKNATYPSNLHQIGYHDDAGWLFLPYHPPEVIHRLMHRTYTQSVLCMITTVFVKKTVLCVTSQITAVMKYAFDSVTVSYPE